MPREVKYRAWDKIDKKMRQVVMLDTYSKFQTVFFNERTSNNNGYRFSSDGCELMEYTGLKDRNGKEIYEGDIVTGLFNYTDIIGPIVYGSDASFFINREGLYGIGLNNAEDWLEVIGNIYENPELLQKE